MLEDGEFAVAFRLAIDVGWAGRGGGEVGGIAAGAREDVVGGDID